MTGRDLLSRAERAGILLHYDPAGGGAPRAASRRTLQLLLRALGESDEGHARSGSRVSRSSVACPDPAERLGQRPGFGLWANLYSLRSDRGLGVGGLWELRQLVRFAAEVGAVFVGTSPLHAVRNAAHDISPYQPLSRLFRNPLYLDVAQVPEWSDSSAAQRLLERRAVERRRLLAADRVDYEGCAALHRELVCELHRVFRARHVRRDTQRGRAYARYLRQRGSLLQDFATFCALEERLAAEGHPRDWRRWPPEFRSPGSLAVRAFRDSHGEEVDLHAFQQFEIDRQLEAVAREAATSGLELGLYADLAAGSAASGFDTWAFPEAFVMDVSIGAPPDDYAEGGQDWGLPPLHPARAASAGDGLFRLLLRAGFGHVRMLRIDHVMGVLRQYWIPRGEPAAAGAYVRFPARDVLEIVAEEARRAGALVVGEDLGTVPRGLTSLLARFRVLSSRVLLFERDSRGRFRPAHAYSRRALVTANTHDLPTLAGLWSGRDLALRRELGLIGSDADLEAARQEREALRRALLRRLSRDGDLRATPEACSYAELCGAVYRFLCRTPSPLVGVSCDDLAGEHEPVNIPGVSSDVFPSWTRRMERSVDSFTGDSEVRKALAGLAARSRGVGR
jgi:4-alpha-glucanotransferase